MISLKYLYNIQSIAVERTKTMQRYHGEKTAMMQQRSTEQCSAVDSRRRLTNFKTLVSSVSEC